MPRKKYSAEFKAEAVELVRSSSSSASAVARDLGLSATMLNRWCREARRSTTPVFRGSGTPRDQELARLKRELAQVKKERDFETQRGQNAAGSSLETQRGQVLHCARKTITNKFI